MRLSYSKRIDELKVRSTKSHEPALTPIFRDGSRFFVDRIFADRVVLCLIRVNPRFIRG